MKIIRLTAANVRRLKAIEIVPDKDGVTLTGKNGSGKSSALDAIWLSIQNAKASKIITEPKRQGEDNAIAIVELDDMTITRRWGKGEGIEVRDKDGKRMSSPQAISDKLAGEISFDPLAFSRNGPKEQTQILQDLAGINLADIEKREKEAYSERTLIARDGKTLKAQLDSLENPDPKTIQDKIDASEVLEKIRQRDEYNEERRIAAKIVDDDKKYLAEYKNDIDNLKSEIESIHAKIADKRAGIEAYEKELKAHKEIAATEWQGPSDLETKLEKAQDHNIEVNRLTKRVEDYQAKITEVKAAQEEWKKADQLVDKMRGEKQEIISKANYPLDGLAVSDGVVKFNDVPFSDLSSGEQIKVSVSIAMALNTELKVIMLRDAALLDDANLKTIKELAKEKEYQLWIETIDSDEKSAIIFEDGVIKGQDPELVNPLKPAMKDKETKGKATPFEI